MPSRTRNFRQLQENSELLTEKVSGLDAARHGVFMERFMISWVFHDFALEGVILTIAEIKSSIDDEIISSPSLINKYNEIISLRDGINYIWSNRSQPVPLTLDWLKRLHQILLPSDKKDQIQYRKDALIHRPYFHDLAAPDKISYRMRKLTEWMEKEGARAHPIELACEIHRELIRILPWTGISGRVARLAMNHILLAEGYWPAIIHHVERQRYYDTLQRDQDELMELCVETMQNGVTASNRLFQSTFDA